MKLVADAHNFWKWWSVRLAILSGMFSAVALAYAGLPADWLPGIPQWIKTGLAAGALLTAAASALSRPVVQTKLSAERPNAGP